MKPEQLRQYLSFYQDLGIKTVYRREAAAPEGSSSAGGHASPASAGGPASPASTGDPASPASTGDPASPASTGDGPDDAPEPATLPGALPGLSPEGDTLATISEAIGDCTRCRLHEGRNKIVFGVGNEQARLVFVGEGPGADEDAQGIPFVGRAGQLLTQMIENTASGEGIPLRRADVYICNVVKCRPPENRAPLPDEMETCGQFLQRQLAAIRPKAICTLGGVATKALLGTREGVTRLRGKWHRWQGIPVMVTYHPSYLLRPYNKNAKRDSWEDLKRAFHYVYD